MTAREPSSTLPLDEKVRLKFLFPRNRHAEEDAATSAVPKSPNDRAGALEAGAVPLSEPHRIASSLDATVFSLADRASLAELLDAVKSVETWTERHAEVLDYCYRRRLAASLSRRSTLEDLREFDRHLAQVTNPIRRNHLDELGKPYWGRWQAYRDLLSFESTGHGDYSFRPGNA